jgi:gamma-glutamyltranspeptidase
MGADGQPQIHAQTYVNLIDHGLDIQTTLSRRRAGCRAALRSARRATRCTSRRGFRARLFASWSAAAT